MYPISTKITYFCNKDSVLPVIKITNVFTTNPFPNLIINIFRKAI